MKQETIEEAAERYSDFSNDHVPICFGDKFNPTSKADFIAGAKYQAEKMYSEEELRQAIKKARDISDGKDCFDAEDISGCTEVCTYDWKFNLSEDSIIAQFKKQAT
ncbi:MAG: hypothetical protein EBZ95_13975 [Chitinophagia bacterium]|nr:hypothetical protein [Chitinophagia bacterium]